MPEISRRQQFLIRRGALQTERSSYIGQYQELSKLITPRTGRFLVTDRNKGGKRHNNIIDNAGSNGLRVLGAGLMAGMTSPARPWFRLGLADRSLMEYGPVKIWLAAVTDIMRTVFTKSNTYRALHMLYEELGAYGTGASIVMDDFEDVIRHYPATCGEYMIATDHRGEVCTLYREFDMTVAAIVAEFGIDAVSPSVRNMFKSGNNLDAWVTVMHIIEPNRDRDVKNPFSKNLPWTSIYMELAGQPAGQLNENQFLREKGFKRFPALCPRWHTAGGDIYGDSPGMEALGDVKQLQHGQLRKTQGIDYRVKPPIQVPTSMKNQPLATLPGGVSYYDQTTPHGGIRSAFDVNLSLTEQLEDIRDVRQRIRGTFYVDLFLMLAQNDSPDASRQPITAREVAERHEEKLLMLGPVLERLHNELLKPKIDLTFDRMIEARIVPPPPQELNGHELQVEFISMLAQAQRAIGVQGVDRLVQTVGTIATFQRNSGMAPTALDKLDVDEIVDQYADMLGVDPNLVIANDQVAVIRKQRAEVQAQAAKQQQMEAAANTAKTLAQAPTNEQNALTDAVGAFSGYSGPGQANAV